jgi:hypothetical protein
MKLTHVVVSRHHSQLCSQHQQEGCSNGAQAGHLPADPGDRGAARGGQQLCGVQGYHSLGRCRRTKQADTTSTMPVVTSESSYAAHWLPTGGCNLN